MSQKGQTHFKNLQHLLPDFQSVSGHFGTLCVKGLNLSKMFHKHYAKIFSLKISSVNVTKSAVSSGFTAHLLKKSLMENFIFLCSNKNCSFSEPHSLRSDIS